MSALRSFRRGRGRGYMFLGATLVVTVAFGVVFVAASGAGLSTSLFEGSDGNMVVDTSGHTDWVSLSAPVLRTLVDVPSGTSDNSFTGGAYSYKHWGVVGVYRDTNSFECADDLIGQLDDLGAFDKEEQS